MSKRLSLLTFALLFIVALSLPALAHPSQQAAACPGFLPSRLIVGELGRVLPGASNNMRVLPESGRDLVGQIPGGESFMVLEGPTCANDLAWWRVDYNGLVGWTVEGSGDEYWLEPAGPAPVILHTATPSPTITPTAIGATACPGFLASRLVAGELGRVLSGDANALRATPVDGERLGEIPGGGVFIVLEGPACAGDLAWWRVDYNGLIGWTAEGSGGEYWLEPMGAIPTPTPTFTPTITLTPSVTPTPTITPTSEPPLPLLTVYNPEVDHFTNGLPENREVITDMNLSRLRPLAVFGHGDFSKVEWSPDGKTIAILTNIGVWLHNAEAPNEQPRFIASPDMPYHTMAFSPNSRLLALGAIGIDNNFDSTTEGRFEVLDLETGARQALYERYLSVPTWSVAFSPNGHRLAVVNRDQIKLFRTSDGVVDQIMPYSHARAVTFSPDSTLLAFITDNLVNIWSIPQNEIQITYESLGGMYKLSFSADNSRLFAAGNGGGNLTPGVLRVWDLINKERVEVTPPTLDNTLTVMAYSPTRELIAVGGEAASNQITRKVRIFNAITHELSATLELPGRVTGLAFSPDGGQLVVVMAQSDAAAVMLFNLDDNTSAAVGGYETFSYNDFAVLSADGSLLATSNYYAGYITVWDTATREIRQRIPYNFARPTQSGFSDDNSQLLIVPVPDTSTSEERLIWDIETGERLETSDANFIIQPHPSHFQADGQAVVSVNEGLNVSGVLALPGDPNLLMIDIAPSLQFWDQDTRQPLKNMRLLGDLVAVSSDGRIILTEHYGSFWLWGVSVDGESLDALPGYVAPTATAMSGG